MYSNQYFSYLSFFFRYNNYMSDIKKRPGRPKKSLHELQTEYLDVRLVLSEKQAFKAAAELAGMPVSTWVRDRLRAAARRELLESGRPVPFHQSQLGV